MRVGSVLVAFTMTVTACGGTDGEEPNAESTTAAPSAATSSASLVGAVATGLTAAGIETVDPQASPLPAGAFQITEFQRDAMIRASSPGQGYLGASLDTLVGALSGLPFSYLIAGWIVASPTEAARNAAEIMGDQDWTHAPDVVFPTAVLAMFAADAIASMESPAAAAAINGRLAFQSGLCSQFTDWFNDVLDFLFESLKVATDDDGFLGFLGTIWNAAIDLARGVVGGLVEVLTAPVVGLIADGLAIIGTLSMVASLLVPWTVTVNESEPRSRYAVGDEPAVENTFTAVVDTNLDVEWPADVRDCAQAAGLDLPDPSSATGSRVTWQVKGLPEHGTALESQATIDADNAAEYAWVTGREASDDGDEQIGVVAVSARVRSYQIATLKRLLEGLITGLLPTEELGDLVGELFAQLAGPVIDDLAELIEASGTSSVRVVYHKEEAPDAESTLPPGGAVVVDECLGGRWTSNAWNLPTLEGPATGGSGIVLEISADGAVALDFASMKPLVVSAAAGTVGWFTAGPATMTLHAVDGSWDVSEPDMSLLDATIVVNDIPNADRPPGQGIWAGMFPGSYTCGDVQFVYSTTTGDGQAITVTYGRG